MKNKKIISIVGIIIIVILSLFIFMKKTSENQTYNTQLSEIMRRISKIESLLNGVPNTTAKIADLAVKTAKIDELAVTTAKIEDLAVTTAKIEDLAVTNAKIKDLTWDKAQGGTLSLGGASNVDGVLSLKDGSGVEKISMNKDGMTINDGKITIKNSVNTAVLDATGLVSAANFKSGSFQRTAAVNTSLNSYFQNVTGESITTINLPRNNTSVFITFNLTTNNSISSYVEYDLSLDGSVIYNSPFYSFVSSDNDFISVSASGILVLSSGTHTLQLIARGMGTLDTEYFSISYLVLGS